MSVSAKTTPLVSRLLTEIHSVAQLATIFFFGATLILNLPTPAQAANRTIVINEVDCHGNDWIELLNTSNQSVNISNWLLTDKKLSVTNALHIYRFPTGTVLPKKSRLVIEQSGLGDLKLPFGIGCQKGGTIRLGQPISPTSMLLIDELLVPITPSGVTFGRYPDGSLKTGFNLRTKNQVNKTALPRLLSPQTIRCSATKICKAKLTASGSGNFALVSKKSGIAISRGGAVVIETKRLKVSTFVLRISNQFGKTETRIKIILK